MQCRCGVDTKGGTPVWRYENGRSGNLQGLLRLKCCSKCGHLISGCAPATMKPHFFVGNPVLRRRVHGLNDIPCAAIIGHETNIRRDEKVVCVVKGRIRAKAGTKCRRPDQTRTFISDQNAAGWLDHRIVAGHLHYDMEYTSRYDVDLGL